jgi:hypothetical protein
LVANPGGRSALASAGASLASGPRQQHLTGVVRSVNASKRTVTITVGRPSRHRTEHPKLATFSIATARVTSGTASIDIGDTVKVTTVGGSGHTLTATVVDVLGTPGGDHGTGVTVPVVRGATTPGPTTPSRPTTPTATTSPPTHVTGQVTAVRSDGLTITVGGVSVTVSVGLKTSIAVADTNGDNFLNLQDIEVGDTVYVQSYNASASPIVARGIADLTHPYVSTGSGA